MMLKNSEKISNNNFTRFPLAFLVICFIAGILISNYSGISSSIFLIFSLVFISLAAIFLNKNSAVILLFIAFTSLGGLCLSLEKSSLAPNRLKVLFESGRLISGEPIEITGISQGKPELAVGGFFLLMKVENIISKGNEEKASGNIRLFLPSQDEQTLQEYDKLQIGHNAKIRVACELNREERFQNPGGVSTKNLLDMQGIDATGVVKSPLLLENLGQTKDFVSLNWIYERRQNLILEFKKNFSVSTAGVLIASLLGNKYHLDKTTAESFREGGTFHILVISGLQITFIGGLVILILRQFTKNRFWQFLLASIFLWAYTLAVGADAPVTRAAIMFTVWYFAYVVFRQASLLNSLAVSALILLVWRPSDLLNQSFQLTFICVLSIVGMSLPLLEKLKEIGNWHPNVHTPIPPNVPKWIKTLAETLYWSEKNWQEEQSRTVWQCKLIKTPYAEKLESWKLQKILRFLFEAIVVSSIVQAWLLPFAVLYFHRVSFVSIFLNIWIGALIAIESLFAIFGIFIAQISEILAAPFIWAAEILNSIILNLTVFFVDKNWSSLRIPHYSGQLRFIYLLYLLPIIALMISLHYWKPLSLGFNIRESRFKIQLASASLIILIGVIIFHPFSSPNPDGKLHIDFLDVGQGDSAFITMPTGETILIDGGGRANFNKIYVHRDGEEAELFEPDVQNIGETVVSNFLWEKGNDNVDYLLATHADTDHIQGLTDVAGNFAVKSAFVARTPMQDVDFEDFAKALEKKNIPLAKIVRGDVLTFGDVKVEVLYPNSDENPNANWDNNHGIVLRIIYGETKVLLTADIEKEAEKELLEMPEVLQANVVKVAHHGSKTSSTQTFIDATKAKLAIISVGKKSPFGHPHQEVVDRWKKSDAKIMTTGEKGTVTIISDGKSISVQTFVK